MSLAGRRFVVTGTSRGMGAGTAQRLKEAGAHVIGMDINRSHENVDQFIRLDLADSQSITAAAAAVEGEIHGLCNVAGVAPNLPLNLVLKINFLGTRDLTLALESKIANNGSIVNLASGTGMGWPRNIAKHKLFFDVSLDDDIDAFAAEHEIVKANCYHFSKEAVVAWTIQQWKRWEDRDIRMNCISPGPVETPLLPDFLSDMTPKDAPMFELKRNGMPEEIVNVILFLLQDESRWINAANIPVDGGLAAVVHKRIHQF